VGAKAYKEPLPSIPPPEVPLDRGTVILVTSASDAIDGDLSSVGALLRSPGPDGVSLREALQATNNSPSIYTIRFAPHLKGTIINVGTWNHTELPPLFGGSVTINGDIDNDGTPDITLTNGVKPHQKGANVFGLQIHSAGNVVHALALKNFSVGVLFGASPTNPTNSTLADNVVSKLVLTEIHVVGIILFSPHGQSGRPGESRNRWVNTRFLGNTIESKGMGIDVSVQVRGDAAERLTIAHNTIRIAQSGEVSSEGIKLGAGAWLNSQGNAIADATIAYNSIEGDPQFGIRVYAGDVGAGGNLVDGVRIFGNRIRLAPGKQALGGKRDAIVVAPGDGATDHVDPNLRPIIYPEGNIVTNLSIVGNVLEGAGGWGVRLMPGCCGARKNTIRHVVIQGNTIRGTVAGVGIPGHSGVFISGSESGHFFTRPSSGNAVSDVLIEANTIRISRMRPLFRGEELTEGGVVLVGGRSSWGNTVGDIRIVNNEVETNVPGVNVLGGWGETQFGANNNTVSNVELKCNLINRPPAGGPFPDPRVKGINLTGGYSWASGNMVQGIRLEDNLVVGTLNDVSLFTDIGEAAFGNSVAAAPSPGP
jgi:hypothetical protein